MSTENLLNQAVKGALAFGAAGSLVGAGAALAQTAAPASATAPAGTNLSTITVTGSRIPQTSIATAQPVISISRQQIEATGFTTVGQLLNNLSQTGTALNTQFNNGGNGSVFVNLHHLGSNRTLVLVDGQRWTTGLGNAVDLTTIPLGIVDHVDVLLDGASAIYGSEAIGGVVNIITVKNFNGAEANAYMGIYNAHGDGGGWDGKTQQYNLTIGTSNDRSSVLFGAGYFERNEIRAGNRTISKEPVNGGGPSYGSAGSPTGLFITLPTGSPTFPGSCVGQSPGAPFTDYCLGGGPFLGPGGSGGPAQPLGYTPYNFAPLSYIRTPAERWYLYSQGHYDLTDNVSFHYRAAYNTRQSDQLLAANPWYFGAGGTLLANGLPLGISGDAQYNPFGHDLVPAYSTASGAGAAWCSLYGSGANGCGSDWAALALLGFRPTSASPRDFRQDVQTYFFNGGFRGFWMMAGNQWTWNADYIYSRTSNTITTTGLHNTARMQKALGPASNCVGAPDGCVPLNLFKAQAGLTSDMADYVGFVAHNVNQTTIRDYNLNIGGGFFNSWYAGPWGVALGYEYYEQDGFFSPDAIIAAGNTDGNVAQPTRGKIKTNAEYAELKIPFARDLPGAKELSLDIAERFSQFKWAGYGNVITGGSNVVVQPTTGSDHSSTGRVALKYRPVSQLLLRASWSQGFRAPSLSELFLGKADSYLPLTDPCAPGPYGGWNGNPADLPPNCPAGASQPTAQILTSLGGNAKLTPEQAISKTVGFVYSPTWAPGLDIQADYYHVEVVNNITTLGAQSILNSCYPKSGTPSFCNLVLRPGNIVGRVLNFNLNGGSQTISGYDAALTYRLPTTPIGNFTVRANGDWVLSDVGCGPLGNCGQAAGSGFTSGFGGEPKYRYQVGLGWDYGAWSANWTAFIIGPMWENCAPATLPNPGDCSNPNKRVGPYDIPPVSGQNHLGTTIYHDVQASYTVSSWDTTFTLGVQNLFNKTPPIARNAFQNGYLAAYYRTPGRFIYGRISVNF